MTCRPRRASASWGPRAHVLAFARRPQHGSPEAGMVRVKSPRDAKHAEERQTTRMRMNAPQVYALRLCKPAEHCSLLAFFGVFAVRPGSTFSSNSSTRANWAPPIVTKSPFFAGDLTKNRRKLLGPDNQGQPL